MGCLCSAFIIFLVCGLVYSYGIWIGDFLILYGGNLGPTLDDQLDAVVLIGAASMSLMIMVGGSTSVWYWYTMIMIFCYTYGDLIIILIFSSARCLHAL